MVSVRWVPDLILCLDCLEVSLGKLEFEDVCVCVSVCVHASGLLLSEILRTFRVGLVTLSICGRCMGKVSAVLDSELKMFLIYLILIYSVHHLSQTSRFSFSPLNLQFCTVGGPHWWGIESLQRGKKS